MKSIVITGANRGIGLGVVKQLASTQSRVELIFAGYRNADRSKELFDLAKQYSNRVIPIQIDTSDNESIDKAKTEVEKILGDNRGLNCLVNNAAVTKNLHLKEVNEKDMHETYDQNVLGPWRVTKIFLPMLEKAAVGERNVLQSSIINISSMMSSISYVTLLPMLSYDYQCAKVALNMFTVCMARDLDKSRIFIALLDPGWTKTDMGGEKAPLTVEQSSKNIVDCLLSLKNEHYGKLVNATDGKKPRVIPF